MAHEILLNSLAEYLNFLLFKAEGTNDDFIAAGIGFWGRLEKCTLCFLICFKELKYSLPVLLEKDESFAARLSNLRVKSALFWKKMHFFTPQ